MIHYPNIDVVATRFKKNTIYKSVFPAIVEACEIMGLVRGKDYFSPNPDNVTPHTHLYFKLRNGSAFVFDGLKKEAGDSKGVKPSRPGNQICGV
jgi:phage terminase large subunit